MSGLSRRDRRAIQLGGGILLSLLFAALIALPLVRETLEARNRLFSERELFAREIALLANLHHTRQEIGTVQDMLDDETSRLFPSASDPLLTLVQFAGYVEGLVALSDASIVDLSHVGATAPESRGVELELEVRLVSDLQGLLTLLLRFESGPSLVSVEAISFETGSSDMLGERPLFSTMVLSAHTRSDGGIQQPVTGGVD